MATAVPAAGEDTNLDAACTTVAAGTGRTDGTASLLVSFTVAGRPDRRTTGAAELPMPAVHPAGFRRRNRRSRGAAGVVLS